MEMPSPLRWLGAIAIMFIVVLIAVPMLINTIGETVRLSTGASEDPLASEGPSGAASEAEGEGDGEDEGGGGDAEGDFPQTYTVAEGDTGEAISERFYGNPEGWPQIAEANDIDPDNPPQVGEELEIPAPEE
jgi:nucleoid-associated protein YgaU